MSRICFITGAKTMFGHSVSHSNIKTNRLFRVNIQEKTLRSDILGCNFPVRISAKGLRTVYKHGSLDAFLLKSKANNLTDEALKIKRRIKKVLNKKVN
ncbi:MAG: 50S ribosomal protein L28 [Proteobacteria bacterium]|jgi:large subunit ribosomal protein L28|nr:50S ribosomal protein L28 [Pseudomonadota bacterium]